MASVIDPYRFLGRQRIGAPVTDLFGLLSVLLILKPCTF
jgi:hypothetical protein